LSCKFIFWRLKRPCRNRRHSLLFREKFYFLWRVFPDRFGFCSWCLRLLEISCSIDLVFRNCGTLGWSVPAEIVGWRVLSRTRLPVFTR
jgi:hypothetical protein